MEHLEIYLHVVDIYDWISIVLTTVLIIFVARLPQTIQKNMPRDVFYTNPSHLKYSSPVKTNIDKLSTIPSCCGGQRENLPTQVLQSDLGSPSWRQLNLWNCHLTNPQKRHKNCRDPKIKCMMPCYPFPSFFVKGNCNPKNGPPVAAAKLLTKGAILGISKNPLAPLLY